MRRHVRLWQYLAAFSVQLEIFRTKVTQKIKTHFILSLISGTAENRVFYELMWKKYGGAKKVTKTKIYTHT